MTLLFVFFSFCLSPKYLRNPWMDLRQIHTEDVFGPLLGWAWMPRSKVKVTRDKTEMLLRHPHRKCTVGVHRIRRTLHMTLSSSRPDHSVAAGRWRGDGSARWRRSTCGLCLVKHLCSSSFIFSFEKLTALECVTKQIVRSSIRRFEVKLKAAAVDFSQHYTVRL